MNATEKTAAPDPEAMLRQFVVLPRDQQLRFLAKAMNAHAAGVKIEAEVRMTPGTG